MGVFAIKGRGRGKFVIEGMREGYSRLIHRRGGGGIQD